MGGERRHLCGGDDKVEGLKMPSLVISVRERRREKKVGEEV
jgi:hypothetical protein